MILIDKLKELGVTITPEIEKQFPGDWITQAEADRKAKKAEALEEEKKQLEEKYSGLEKEVKELRDSAGDVDALNAKIEELNTTLEAERKERAAKEETDRLTAQVADFFSDKHFVNDITADSIKNTLVAELQKDTAKGRSLSDIFDSIVKDDKGEYKPNILITQKDLEAQKNRSQRIGNNINGQQGGNRISIAELMKQKNQNPDMDIMPYLRQ
jgi:vacuolar-type H+-ATPase subunit I/STV1